VTCSAVHGLKTNYQISVQGLLNSNADGFYSVNVLTATAFTYMTYGGIPAASLLTPTTRIVTALIGLPYGFETIPKIDGPGLVLNPFIPDTDITTEGGEIITTEGGQALQEG
jgi:hypothetical protein